jgi:serine/threonine-protein kinase RsbW
VAGRVWRLLPARAEAVPIARRLIGDLKVDGPTAGVLELLTSELVTNAVMHGPAGADDQISLVARLEQDRVFVEVCDEGGDAEPIVTELDPLEPGGLGLRLVDGLATEWGTHRDGVRCVWFRLVQEAAC